MCNSISSYCRCLRVLEDGMKALSLVGSAIWRVQGHDGSFTQSQSERLISNLLVDKILCMLVQHPFVHRLLVGEDLSDPFETRST
jgi:hypothetical protein